MYDPVADLRLAAALLASIHTGRPEVDVRIKALAVEVTAIADSGGRSADAAFYSFYSPGDRDAL